MDVTTLSSSWFYDFVESNNLQKQIFDILIVVLWFQYNCLCFCILYNASKVLDAQ